MIRAIQPLPDPLSIIIIDDDGKKRNERWDVTYIEIEQCKCIKQCFHFIKRKMVCMQLWSKVTVMATSMKKGRKKYVKIGTNIVAFIGIHSVKWFTISSSWYTLLLTNKTWLIFSLQCKKEKWNLLLLFGKRWTGGWFNVSRFSNEQKNVERKKNDNGGETQFKCFCSSYSSELANYWLYTVYFIKWRKSWNPIQNIIWMAYSWLSTFLFA